jgi:hypothetical protein
MIGKLQLVFFEAFRRSESRGGLFDSPFYTSAVTLS